MRHVARGERNEPWLMRIGGGCEAPRLMELRNSDERTQHAQVAYRRPCSRRNASAQRASSPVSGGSGSWW